VLALLTPRQRIKSVMLVLLTVATAGMETVGIASIGPYLAALSKPDIIETKDSLRRVYTLLTDWGLDHRQFLLLLGAVAFVGLLSSTGFRALNLWAQIRFNRSVEYALACRLMTDYLRRPYHFFLSRNSADMTKMVLSEVAQVVNGFLAPSISFLSSVITAIFLCVLLVVMSPVLALIVTAAISAAYGLTYLAMRQWLTNLGHRRLDANQRRFTAASEVFGGIKEIKLLGNERAYLKRFSRAYLDVVRSQAGVSLAGNLPSYGLELMVMGGGLAAATYLFRDSEIMAQMLPSVAVYLLCARRMLPAVRGVFKSLTQLRFSQPTVGRVIEDFHQGEALAALAPTESPESAFTFKDRIVLEDVGFTYPAAPAAAISNISLNIRAGTRVGFVGATGSGKTTTMDLLLGLLTPSMGRLLIDGMPITPRNIRAWQVQVGYVPQHVYLADDTVAANIALGVSSERIDQQAVERAAQLAAIHDFIVGELAQGYATAVGERGVRLSGGQRQRIGIARALYHSPKILFFDEATSSLDMLTEKAVIEGLRTECSGTTMIFIAHRLNTVRDCDVIYMFERGRLKASGTYVELMGASPDFRSLAAHADVHAEQAEASEPARAAI
jgi:ATP-binding cassette, subfamily B, bacterial PglK